MKIGETVVGLVHSVSKDAAFVAVKFEHTPDWFILKGVGHEIDNGDMLVIRHIGNCPCGDTSCHYKGWEVVEDES